MTRTNRKLRFASKSEINIVPLLDVLLVLLLIFMATSPIINQSVEVDLPESSQSNAISTADKMPIIVEVAGIGVYNLIIDQNKHNKLTENELIAAIKQQANIENNIFFIGGAKNVPYDEIIKAINILKKTGIKSVGLMTQSI